MFHFSGIRGMGRYQMGGGETLFHLLHHDIGARKFLQIRVTVDEEEFEDGKNFRLQDVRSMVDVTASVPHDSSPSVPPS